MSKQRKEYIPPSKKNHFTNRWKRTSVLPNIATTNYSIHSVTKYLLQITFTEGTPHLKCSDTKINKEELSYIKRMSYLW